MVILCKTLSQFGAGIFIPFLYQDVLGLSATNSGTLLTPMLIAMLVFGILAGQLMVWIRPYRFLNTIGLALMMVGLLLLTVVTINTNAWEVVRDTVVIGAGLGILFALSTAVVQTALSRHVVGVATSQVQFWRNIGGTVGATVLGALLSASLGGTAQAHVSSARLADALHVLFLVAAISLVVPLVASVFLREVPLGNRTLEAHDIVDKRPTTDHVSS